MPYNKNIADRGESLANLLKALYQQAGLRWGKDQDDLVSDIVEGIFEDAVATAVEEIRDRLKSFARNDNDWIV